jgi:D-alanyl-D-alanine carboxypeptidase (penicillin-binding protein 5/6)
VRTRAFSAVLLTAALLALGAPAAAQDEGGPQGGDGATLVAPAQARVDAAAPPLPDVPVRAFLLADLDTGAVLAEQAPHQPLPPASTLKALTALALLPGLDLEATVVAPPEAVAVHGTRVGIEAGSSYTGRQLAEAMLLMSANDAAETLAVLGGGREQALAAMQAEARRLGAERTVVRNPSGLDAPGQVSTAYDLALIGRAALARPDIAALATLRAARFPAGGPGAPDERPTFEIANHNDLVTGGYDGGVGLKSGYTTLAGRTMIGAAERDGRRYLVTLLGISGPTYGSAAAFLDWAFANGAAVAPVGQLPPAPDAWPAGAQAQAAAAGPGAQDPSSPPPAWPILLVVAVAALVAGLRIRARARLAAAQAHRAATDPDRASAAPRHLVR